METFLSGADAVLAILRTVLLSIAESTLSGKIRAFEIDVEKFKRDRS